MRPFFAGAILGLLIGGVIYFGPEFKAKCRTDAQIPDVLERQTGAILRVARALEGR